MFNDLMLLLFFVGLLIATVHLSMVFRKYPRVSTLVAIVVTGIAFSFHVPVHAQTKVQIILEKDLIKDLKNTVTFHLVVLVQKGDGCTQVTKRTNYPLTREQCIELLESYGRKSIVDRRNSKKRVVMDPVVYEGESFAYISTKNQKGWAFRPLRKD